MLQRVRNYIENKNMLEKEDSVLLGVSGGADSICLFYVMLQLAEEMKLRLYVVHVNHGIRNEDAKGDASFVRSLCKEKKIPFYLFEEDVPYLAKKCGMSEEEAGRSVRYHHFMEVAAQVGASKIATAHHQGDQVETILFHFARGTNLAGMRGMMPITKLEAGDMTIIRPLLELSKEDIVKWLEKNGYNWRYDITNEDNQYARNKIRNQIVPLLKEVNEQAEKHIVEFAKNANELQSFLNRMIERYTKEHVDIIYNDNGERIEYKVNREILVKEDSVFVDALLYEWITGCAGKKVDITKEHVEAARKLLSAQSGKSIDLPYEVKAFVSYEMLIIRKSFHQESVGNQHDECWEHSLTVGKNEKIYMPNGNVLRISYLDFWKYSEADKKAFIAKMMNSKNIYTKVFDCDTIKNTLCVREVKTEDYFVINDQGNRKKLSRYFIDCKIPREQRDGMIVVATENEVLWLVEHRRCNNHKITQETKQILLVSCEGEDNGKAN